MDGFVAGALSARNCNGNRRILRNRAKRLRAYMQAASLVYAGCDDTLALRAYLSRCAKSWMEGWHAGI
ncbi:hypothetical protein, partial [Escherichia coli]|uniref:hypothetical protein n=1 Tax=Escherichia coli TaxID=562 RepID=UPI00195FC70D